MTWHRGPRATSPPSELERPQVHLWDEAGLAVGGGVEFEDDEFVAVLAEDGAWDVEGALGAAGPVAAETEAVDPDDALAPALRVQVKVACLGKVEYGAAERGADEGVGVAWSSAVPGSPSSTATESITPNPRSFAATGSMSSRLSGSTPHSVTSLPLICAGAIRPLGSPMRGP